MMMKKRLAKTIVVFALLCLATPLYASTPWLHAAGNVIKDPCGNTVVLRGVDLLDLGFLEDWQGGAIEMIDRLTNKSDTQGSSPGWYPRVLRIMITPPDAVGYGWPHPFDPDDDDFYDNLLRPVVDYCKTKDLYVIIDWHYVANTYDHVADTSAFWTYMAPRFANDSHVIFELFNEPINDLNGDWIFNSHDTADWQSVRNDMNTWINIVRTYAPNNLILVAGAYYSQVIGPAAAYPVTGDNIGIVSHI
jgi:endoglucanase